MRVARCLGSLPRTDEALRLAQVSYSQVRALTRVATPAHEAVLLAYARAGTTAQLEKICRLFRQVRDRAAPPLHPEEDAARPWVRLRATDDDRVRLEASLRPEEAALVMKAIDACRPEPGASRVEALVAMAEAILRAPPARGDDGCPRRPIEVMLHVDRDTMAGSLEDGTRVSAETSRRLTCDAAMVTVVHGADGEVLDVGRRSRTLPTPLRRGLVARDGGCRFPGCTRRRIEGHHLVHWSQGGETKLSNGIGLCRFHHVCVRACR